MRVSLHAGQKRALDSGRRFVLVLAGTQSGKTSFGPHWLLREMQLRGPGDYLVVTPTFPLLEVKLLPEFKQLFERAMRLGRYIASPTRRFEVSDGGARSLWGEKARGTVSRVLFGYAADPDSLESSTCKAAWLDEVGQESFKSGSWDAILSRLSLAMGRVLLTTTVYTLGWVKQRLFDRWQAGDTDVEVVNFPSTANPEFPRDEFERARRDLPGWKFAMRYLGQFERPAGVIYDCVGADTFVPRFAIARDWKRYLGLDFGQKNMAAVWLAEEPKTSRLFITHEYHRGGLSVPAHVREIMKGHDGLPWRAVGGAGSEDEWRDDFRGAGLPVREPQIADVELGIDRVYGALQAGRLCVFDDLTELREEFATYSRVLNEANEVTEAIANKNEFHLLDSTRYIVSDLSGRVGRRATGPQRLKSWYQHG